MNVQLVQHKECDVHAYACLSGVALQGRTRCQTSLYNSEALSLRCTALWQLTNLLMYIQAEEASTGLGAAQKADEEHRVEVCRQLKEHAAHNQELGSALEQAKAALSSQQTQALAELQAETQRQSQELQQRMQELQEQVCTLR